MTRVESSGVSFLLASPERAIADKVREDRSATVRSFSDAEAYLFANLRIDEVAYEQLDHVAFREIGEAFGSRKALFCARLLLKMKGKK